MTIEIEQQKQQRMEVGFVVVRDMIPPAELQQLRERVDTIVEKALAPGRVTLTD
jgi:hypothetical protein